MSLPKPLSQYPLPLPHREGMDASDYLVTDSNRDAMGWVDQWPTWSGSCLIIYGPAGSGKTHLAQVWQTRSQALAVTLASLIVNEPGAIVETNQNILLDGADEVGGKSDAEVKLFHLYNRVLEAKGSLLLTGKYPVAQWSIDLPDLRSRLMAAPAVGLATPDDQLIIGLLLKQFHDRQIDIGMDVIDYLLPRITRTQAAIRDIVVRLDQTSLALHKSITTALARQLLEQLD
jgi:DnaA regulatory inactivator Hda